MSIALNTAYTMDGPTTESDADFGQEASDDHDDVRTYEHNAAQPLNKPDYLLEVGTEPEKMPQPSNLPDMGAKGDGPTATQSQPSDLGIDAGGDTGFILPLEGERESTHPTCPSADRRSLHINEEFDKLNVSDSCEQSRFHSRFENIEVIGKGGYGKVFKCTHDDCAYAVKRIQLLDMMDPKNVKKAKREVEILSNLDHRNIVAYHHCWIERHPAGWLKDKDKEYLLGSSQSGSFTESSSQQSDNGTFLGVTQKKSREESSSVATSEESGPGTTVQVDTSYACYGSKNKSSPHENKLPLSEGQTTEQFLYIQMELCKYGDWKLEYEDDKHSLRGRLLGEDRGALRVEETFVQLVDALEYIHSRNVIHRDLKCIVWGRCAC